MGFKRHPLKAFSSFLQRHIYGAILRQAYNPKVLKRATDAYETLNIPYSFTPIRGGTDGANLSFSGLPCPNLGDGGYNFHGRFEYVSITQMRKMVKILLEILKVK